MVTNFFPILVDYQTLQANLSERLEQALGTGAPLLREVFLDFAPYLTKTLLGTKGQELLSGGKCICQQRIY